MIKEFEFEHGYAVEYTEDSIPNKYSSISGYHPVMVTEFLTNNGDFIIMSVPQNLSAFFFGRANANGSLNNLIALVNEFILSNSSSMISFDFRKLVKNRILWFVLHDSWCAPFDGKLAFTIDGIQNISVWGTGMSSQFIDQRRVLVMVQDKHGIQYTMQLSPMATYTTWVHSGDRYDIFTDGEEARRKAVDLYGARFKQYRQAYNNLHKQASAFIQTTKRPD